MNRPGSETRMLIPNNVNVRVCRFIITTLCLSALCGRTLAIDKVDYLTDIKPILAEKCYSCHGVLKQESGLRLETLELILAGGDGGAILEPGSIANSVIVDRVTASPDERMPPDGEGTALTPAEIAMLKSWIEQGAIAPHEEIPSGPSDHWAFQVPRRAAIPVVTDADWQSHPIDAFVASLHEDQKLQPVAVAPRKLLIRRLYLDLIGLPPTRQQLNDERPWQEIVEDVLASPQYGERWGRHWMDVWRYADWFGLGAQLRNSQKHIWHWRDWIVESLNQDKGYDRMLQEMLAGDELAPNDPDVLRATGFLARNYYLFNRTTWLDSTIEHTGKAFLGLTLNCAKCHDHKYDPITHVDYYSFRAIFEPHQVRLDPVRGVTDFESDGLPRVFDDHLDAKTFLHLRGDPKTPDTQTVITPSVPAILAEFAPNIQPVQLPVEAYAPSVREYVQDDQLKAATARVEKSRQQLEAAKSKLAQALKHAAEAPTTSSAEPNPFEIHDTFDQARPEIWDIVGSGWKYQDGALVQTTATRESQLARLRTPLPQDFELTCRYTPTGGTEYKSVTFRFDQSTDGKYGNFVYTSAHAPGPKLQAAYTRNAAQTYPSEGRVAKPITIGTTYTIRFAVRGTLINVWLNDEFALAYRYPDRGTNGTLSLSGFDAIVEFDEITVRTLSPDFELTEAKSGAAQNPENMELAVNVAAARLAADESSHASLQATFAADRARYLQPEDQETWRKLSAVAALRQAEANLAEARHDLLVNSADAGKRKAAQKKLSEAEKQLQQVRDAKPDAYEYVSVRAAKKALESPAEKEDDYPVTYPSTSTGRRLALARWMTSTQNPLTARVAVNHIWLRHFGTPLVESVTDFGLRARQPVHHRLLDWLAVEFMESGWSMKHLHRIMVTSRTWQLSTSTEHADSATRAADSANIYYWRRNPVRMESQVIRDSLISLAGVLDPTMGGANIDPDKKSEVYRRSLYFTHSRDGRDAFLSMFDDADILRCYRRSESVVPQQALALANSEVALSMARRIAARISSDAGNDQAFVTAVYQILLATEPTAEEVALCTEAMSQTRAAILGKSPEETERRVRENLVHALLNHNDFITIR